MISKLIKRGEQYSCSNCMMRQPTIKNCCWFCGNIFSNFEEVMLEIYDIIEEDKRRSD